MLTPVLKLAEGVLTAPREVLGYPRAPGRRITTHTTNRDPQEVSLPAARCWLGHVLKGFANRQTPSRAYQVKAFKV